MATATVSAVLADGGVPRSTLPPAEPVQERGAGPDAVDTIGVHFQANCSLCNGTITQCLSGWMADHKQAAGPAARADLSHRQLKKEETDEGWWKLLQPDGADANVSTTEHPDL